MPEHLYLTYGGKGYYNKIAFFRKHNYNRFLRTYVNLNIIQYPGNKKDYFAFVD